MQDISSTIKSTYRSVFLSDFHIGAKTFNAPALLDFLRKTDTRFLYLVGDIIDGWKLHKRWYWTEDVSAVIDELFLKAARGTKIIYITGNHDEAVREFSMLDRLRYSRRMGIQIRNRIHHRLLDGRELLVLHGDQFDHAILRTRLSRWSDRLYDLITDRLLHRAGPMIKIEGQYKRFSLAKFLSYQGQVALNILSNFEAAIVREAKRSHVDGIVCGHTHIPALKSLGPVLYANCGSWLKNPCTALVETQDGNLELIDWPAITKDQNQTAFAFLKEDDVYVVEPAFQFRARTERLKAFIRKTWPSPHDASEKEGQIRTFLAPLRKQTA